MGKWAEIECNRPNRVPLPNSTFVHEPHRRKRRLTKREAQEREEWKRTTEGMFECGHRKGVILELWPGDIVHLGNLAGRISGDGERAFEVFAKVGDWRCYKEELLLISPDEAVEWLSEIDEIWQVMSGAGTLPRPEMKALILELFRAELGARADLEEGLKTAAENLPFARVVPLIQNVRETELPSIESAVKKIAGALRDAAELCRVSIGIGKPIRLLW